MQRSQKNPGHIHKYIRVRFSKKHEVYKCALIACPHSLKKELAVGRISICWRCGEAFVMTKHSITLEKPHCIPCTRGKVKTTEEGIEIDHASIKDFMERLEGDTGE